MMMMMMISYTIDYEFDMKCEIYSPQKETNIA